MRSAAGDLIIFRLVEPVIIVRSVHAQHRSLLHLSFNPSPCAAVSGAVMQVSTPGDFATPKSRLYSISRPSDYMLTHLKRFAEEDADRGSQWAAVLEATVQVRMAGDLPVGSVICAAPVLPSELSRQGRSHETRRACMAMCCGIPHAYAAPYHIFNDISHFQRRSSGGCAARLCTSMVMHLARGFRREKIKQTRPGSV